MTSSNIMIQRKRLMRLADSLSEFRLIYVQAPAGYGKTVFAGQWLDSRRVPGVVITLDRYDNAVKELCCKLRAVFSGLFAEEEITEAAEFIRHPAFHKAPEEFLMRAAVRMPKTGEGGIVIDDLHNLTDIRGQKILQDFLMRLPAGIKICILSRSAPPEAFSSLVLKDEIGFISQEQMRFDRDEICALYKCKNIAVTKKQAESVLTFTEGWPISIRALLLSSECIPTGNMPRELLESFLKTQVWGMWEERFREFMIATCIEEELSESLCNALTGRDDSEVILGQLCRSGAFLFRQRNGNYRFQGLFGDFLRKQFAARPEEYRVRQIRISARWHQEHHHFYQAVKKFSYIKDYEQIACCFDSLEQIDRAGFDTEQVMRAVHDVLDHDIAQRYPYLYFMMAFTARNEGRIGTFIDYADRYYSNYQRIVERNPELAHNIFFLYVLDVRFTLKDIARMASGAQESAKFQGVRGSATLYFPFYHRSYRDFSELLPGDIDTEIRMLAETLGPLLGEECTMLTECVRAGLYYEKGSLWKAQEIALQAVAGMQASFTPESKFCAMVLLLMVNHAMGQQGEAERVHTQIQKMIEEDKAYYLQFNLDALAAKNRMDSGDTDAARNWLDTRGMDVYEEAVFFYLYGYFTTARAHIVLGEFNQAIILLEKILGMCKDLKRPVDVIEANLLLAAAYSKKKHSNQKKAQAYLEEAVRIAQPLGYEQAFVQEGARICNLLSGLKNWTMRSDYNGDLSETFVRRLYIRTMEQSRGNRELAGREIEVPVRLTRQQKRVAKLMCDGYSYRKIAEELGIKFSTVRSHIELIYRKLDVSSMNDAILKIRKLNLLEEP